MGLTCELLVQGADGQRRHVPLDRQRRFTLGRSTDNDLVFPEEHTLSRQHLAIYQTGDAWLVQDLGSKNGTKLNGVRIDSPARLAPGDQIAAGRINVWFQDRATSSRETVMFVPDPVTTGSARVVAADDSSVRDLLSRPSMAAAGRVQALLDAGRELDAHRPLEELFPLILDLSMKTTGARRGVLMTYEGAELVVRAARGSDFRISNEVRRAVLERGQALYVTDTSLDSALCRSDSLAGQLVKSLLAAPLRTAERIIGLIYLDSPGVVQPFTSDDLMMLSVMANIAAVRIENVRLVEVEQGERVLQKELEQAAEMQRNLLPAAAPIHATLELAGRSLPCRAVGGDYFDYLPLPGGRLGVLVADVAGKGISAAMLMAGLQARVQLLAETCADLAELISRLNRSIASNCPGNRFITLFICAIDPSSGAFDYCNAGHNPPFLLRAAGGTETLEEGGPVLGVLKQAGYSAGRGRLHPGDALALFSDGMVDAASPEGNEFGEDRLRQVLESCRARAAGEILTEAFEQTERFMGNAPAPDDMTMVVARRPPA